MHRKLNLIVSFLGGLIGVMVSVAFARGWFDKYPELLEALIIGFIGGLVIGVVLKFLLRKNYKENEYVRYAPLICILCGLIGGIPLSVVAAGIIYYVACRRKKKMEIQNAD